MASLWSQTKNDGNSVWKNIVKPVPVSSSYNSRIVERLALRCMATIAIMFMAILPMGLIACKRDTK